MEAEGLWLASGRTGPGGTALVPALPAGPVRVTVRAPDGRRAEVAVRIEEGTEVPVTLSLRDE
ncbi:MAG: carboxypeptidase-like regulatory domain-containing protein [Planctomycetes bacterium]|nr:carboxypeptidase-like regulatory domain-containing protein [Planctomycetota bacterium]